MMATSRTFLPALENTPHNFLQPSLPLYTDAVAYLKHILDPLAKNVSEEQQQRLKASRKKRKRGEGGDEEILRLKQIHTDGCSVDQVWEQARRVIDAAREEAERAYIQLGNDETDEVEGPKQNGKAVRFEDESEAEGEDLGMEGVDYEVEGLDDGEEEYHTSEDEDEDAHDPENMEDMHDDFDDMEEEEDEADGHDEPAELVQDKFGLNDGFFSIDDFNRQSEFLEQQDARGDDDGAASDEEDIDWDADPGDQAAAETAGEAGEAENGDDDDEEDGPTFGDPDASSEDEDEEIEGGGMDGLGDMGNTNEIMYKDFFAPPAQKKKKNKKGRPNPHNFPNASKNGADAEEEDTNVERAMEKVKFDLFEDESEVEEEEDEQLDPADPRSRRSAHERRKAQLAEEIRKLEAANVAKREWQLSGEARAADRPVNALLEEDLEFERAGKPVPVITAEVSESIEELIKRRILAHDFQDIIRRRPDDLATGAGGGKRGKLDFTLDDTKSKKGLAEEYEEEFSKRNDPNYIDIKDEKLEKEQKEIEKLWKDVCAQLDSLSSWNFRPKQAAPTMNIRVDAPAITMEDARPSAGGEVAGASQLAPQEVYKAGEAVNGKEEVAGKSGLPAAREEMSREERKRRRRREKERIRKSSSNTDPKTTESRASKSKKEKEGIVGDLKRGNVKIIGKKGKITDVEGKEARNSVGGQGAARFKL